MIEVELPYPPSINHYWRRVGPRTLISREGRRFRKSVLAILAAMRVEPLEGDLEASLDYFPPDRRRRDADNLQKAVFDALEKAGVYANDSQVKKFTVEMHPPLPGGKTIVRIWTR